MASDKKTDEKPPPGFTKESWAAVCAQLDKHTDPETDTVDVEAFNAEADANWKKAERD